MNPEFIVIDGKVYRSVDEMPPDVRQKYEKALRALPDTNGNQIPDAFESMNIFGGKNQNDVTNMRGDIAAGKGTVKKMKIIIDGKEFNSIEDLPPDVRQKYEKTMRALNAGNISGMSETIDVFAEVNKALENVTADRLKTVLKVNSTDLKSLTPEQRAQLEQVMGKLDANQNGIPDFIEGLINATNQTANVSSSFGVETPRSTSFDNRPSTPTSPDVSLPAIPTTEIDTSNGWQLVLAASFVILLCVAGTAGVWYFFLR